MELDESHFGSPGRMKEYKLLSYIGLSLLIIGGLLFLFKEIWSVIGVVLIFIGLMCIVGGGLGLHEEKKKQGIKRKSTTFGIVALILGMASVFLSNRPYVAIILGLIAIIFAIKSVKEGDNEYGLAGGICGLIGIIVNLYVWILLGLF